MPDAAALFTAEEARAADAAAIASGITSQQLMRNAATACVNTITALYAPCPVLVVCGAGNNGGDGRLIAEMLSQQGWQVSTADTQNYDHSKLAHVALVVDALFGTGLNRAIEGAAAAIIEQINASGLPVLSVDIASGINATTGEVMGTAIHATHTVTFVRPKLGQCLLPGKAHTGTLHVADIGITAEGITPQHALNTPHLWTAQLPRPCLLSHKYTRGHAVVMGGGMASAGATKLAATAALRAGAGLVSVACDSQSLPVYAASLAAVMTKPCDTPQQLDTLLQDPRITALLIGPGYGVGNNTRDTVLQLLGYEKPCVLDADALTSFKNNPQSLFNAIRSPVVLTPHEGEFARLFHTEGSKAERAEAAAKTSKSVIVLKGNDTVIASPDGRICVNANAPAWLATAGSGDVLAGIITGLLAQGMPVFEAACAATWIHGQAASNEGAGLISEDLLHGLHSVIATLHNQ